MATLTNLIKKLGVQFQTFDLLFQYLQSIAGQWTNILFGESVLAVIFLVWWALGLPPLILIFMCALLVAGYYAWRASYIVTLPKIAVKNILLTSTPLFNSSEQRLYVHVVPECLTDTAVTGCQGILLRVMRKSDAGWEQTAMDEPLELHWSIHDNSAPRTLSPGVPTRLNLCWTTNANNNLNAAVDRMPARCALALNADETFRFDVRITAQNCPPINASITVKRGNAWDKMEAELLPSGL